MIILFHPRATKPRNCRLPLAVLALAAVLEGREEYRIIDGNLEDDPAGAIVRAIDMNQVELLGVSCMPGPQMVAAMEACREVRRLRPRVRIVWGGYFPSLYPDTALNAKYVDYVVRGQGEDTLLELIDALRGKRSFDSILGLCYKDAFGFHRTNPERPIRARMSFPGHLFIASRWRNTCGPRSSGSARLSIMPALAALSTAVSAECMRRTAEQNEWSLPSGR
jgi:anaerobic magnesium-protoporphyrin IX monomethyl ester cyclase